LIFQPGLTSDLDPFDYVDPQWEPLTIATQTGRNLMVAAKGLLPGTVGLFSGLSDTYALPEVVWRFSIRRLMVPFLPSLTIGAFTNKVNGLEFTRVGNLHFAKGTVRMETPEVIARRAPDGQLYWDILLKFLVRRLYDKYYDPATIPPGFDTGWIGWNWAYATPHGRAFASGVPLRDACYYPVYWSTIIFALGGSHPLFADDTTIDPAGLIAPGDGLNPWLDSAPFQAGFYPNQ